MKKLFLFLLIFTAFTAKSQVYQNDAAYGRSIDRYEVRKALHIPTFCGVPNLTGDVLLKKAAIAYDSCNAKFYVYNPSDSSWNEAGLSRSTVDSILGGYYTRGQVDSIVTVVNSSLDLKLNISDTASMLSPYVQRGELRDTAAAIRSSISGGSVQTVTGLNTDNTDPINPVVKISVDGTTITGLGTPASPLVAVGGGGGGGITSIQTQTVSGGAVTFTSVPTTYADYEIFRNGVRNYPVTDYTTSGNVITGIGWDNGDIIILQRIK
jgi:hypothetical protein